METLDYTVENCETRVQITGKPTFKRLSDFWDLSIEGLDPVRYRYLSWPAVAPDPASLDTSKQWTFEILRQESRAYDFTRAELLKVSVDDRLIFDSSLCEAHQRKMSRVVDVCDEYAGRSTPRGFDFQRIRRSQFPNSGTSFPACTFYPGRELTWQCPECKVAAKRWGDRYLKNQPSF